MRSCADIRGRNDAWREFRDAADVGVCALQMRERYI